MQDITIYVLLHIGNSSRTKVEKKSCVGQCEYHSYQFYKSLKHPINK